MPKRVVASRSPQLTGYTDSVQRITSLYAGHCSQRALYAWVWTVQHYVCVSPLFVFNRTAPTARWPISHILLLNFALAHPIVDGFAHESQYSPKNPDLLRPAAIDPRVAGGQLNHSQAKLGRYPTLVFVSTGSLFP